MALRPLIHSHDGDDDAAVRSVVACPPRPFRSFGGALHNIVQYILPATTVVGVARLRSTTKLSVVAVIVLVSVIRLIRQHQRSSSRLDVRWRSNGDRRRRRRRRLRRRCRCRRLRRRGASAADADRIMIHRQLRSEDCILSVVVWRRKEPLESAHRHTYTLNH